MKKVEICPETGRRRVYTENTQPSKTDQQWKKECDANHILKKFATTGQFTHTAKNPGIYQDCSEIKDLHGSLVQVKSAEYEFRNLPAHIRKRFNNSMLDYVTFIQDPSKNEEAIALGLKVGLERAPTESNEGASKKTKTKTTKPKTENTKTETDT